MRGQALAASRWRGGYPQLSRQAIAASRWKGGYPQLSRQAIAASRWKGGYPQLPRQAVAASRWKGGYPQLPRQAIVASRWKGGQISTITPIGSSCQKMERWIHNYDYPDMHWLPVGGEVDRDQQLPGVTREKYSPRQIYSRVKLAHADFTPPWPETSPPPPHPKKTTTKNINNKIHTHMREFAPTRILLPFK